MEEVQTIDWRMPALRARPRIGACPTCGTVGSRENGAFIPGTRAKRSSVLRCGGCGSLFVILPPGRPTLLEPELRAAVELRTR